MLTANIFKVLNYEIIKLVIKLKIDYKTNN